MKKSVSIAGLLLLISHSITPLLASDRNIDHEFDDVIVSASNIAQSPDHVGSSVTVLNRETLLKRGDRTVVDSLSRVPSVTFARSGGVGGVTHVRLRGTNPGQTLVLIDGIRVGDAAGIDNSFDFSTLLVTDIEKIEILRGNQSALYGSDAIGGVINITTYKREKDLGGNAFLEGGSFGTAHGGASVKGGKDNIFYGLSANHFHNDGFSRRNTGKELDGNQISHIRGNFGVDVTPDLTLAFNGGYELANFEYDSGFSASQFSDGDKELLYGQAQATYFAFDDRLKNNAFYRLSQTDRHDNDGAGFMSDFLSTTQIVGYQGDLMLLERDVLTLGIDHRYEESESINSFSTKNTFSMDNTAYFINYIKGFGENITLTLGGRLDDHNQFGTQGTYRSTLAYTIPQTDSKFHASIGSGFKAPSLFQLFDSFSGNPNLEAEESVGWDLGLTQHFLNRDVTADVTFFKTRFDNLIQWSGGRYENINQANIQGIETSLDIKATENLSFFGNYTYTDAEDEITNLRLLRRPKHMFNMGTDIQIDKFSTNILGRFVGDQVDSSFTGENKAFFTADINSSYRLTETTSLYGRLENIFDSDYQEVLTYNTPGFSAFGGIRIQY